MMTASYDKLMEKWAPVLNEESAGAITDNHRKAVTAAILENQEREMNEQSQQLHEAVPTNATANVANWNPVLIALVRRAMPNLMAYDICGVQPMSGPTGLIFAMKSQYKTTRAGATSGDEALAINEPVSGFSGDSASTQSNDTSGLGTLAAVDSAGAAADFGGGMSTEDAEGLGSAAGDPNSAFAEMGFTIEKATVTAKSRALKAEYSLELAQDLKAIHGLDAETELANILSTEIMAEINREVVRTINAQAKTGATTSNTTTNGIFDLNTDADGRRSIERIKGLIIQIEREANTIAKETRRGKGNFIMCSSDVAAALAASGMLDYTPAIQGNANLSVDDTGSTFAGTISGGMKVYIDPYANIDYVNVGYKGPNPYDAGPFYCPYVPLTMVRAVGENSFQPKIGFKTRYGMIANPYADQTGSIGAVRTNQYYRITKITNILS